MAFELLFNAFLLLIAIICFVNITMVAPEPIQGNMDAAQWPQIIFGLLIICLIANMIKVYKGTPAEKRNFDQLKGISLQGILKSKVTWAFVTLFAVIPAFKTIGFIPTGLIFCVIFTMLFGERKPLRIILAALIITLVLYTLFINLNIMLPRGTGFFRSFHLFAEGLARF